MDNISLGQKRYLEALEKNRIKVRIFQITILIAFFTLWELAANKNIIDPFIFSCPSRIFACLIQMCAEGTLLYHIGITLFEACTGFILGTALGTLLAVILWWNTSLQKILDPYLVVLNSLPKTALAPIIIVWMGNNISSIIVTALMTSVIVTLLSVLAGFMSVEEDKILLARTFNASKAQILSHVVFPASVPAIINALKINVGLSFVGVMVGEFLVAGAGLGYLIVYGSQVFKLDWVMLSVLILAILSALMYKCISLAEEKLTARWNKKA